MKNALKISAPILTLVLVLSAATAFADGSDLKIIPARHVQLSVDEVQTQNSGLLITGKVQRHHFSPRSRVSGHVVAEIQSASGEVLDRFEADIAPRAVPKGLGASSFSIQVTKPMPKGSHLVLSFI